MDLDALDRELMRLLLQDGRQSFRRLALRLNVSVPTVKSRYSRLLRLGIVRKVSAIIDPNILGYTTVLMNLKVEPTYIDGVIEYLKGLDRVDGIWLITGEANLLIRIRFKSIDMLEEFKKMLTADNKGVNILSTQIVTKVIKDEYHHGSDLNLGIKFVCSYCKGSIQGEPLIFNADSREYMLCCSSCLRLLREDLSL